MTSTILFNLKPRILAPVLALQWVAVHAVDWYQEDKDSSNQVPSWEAFFLVGSWLRPEDFGFGHPLLGEGQQ